ncbi:MAG TPA: phage holin family protein [Blastocatellia bacterium]|nr:phage holin family protein [Blastocatellia bacterium]
MQPRREVNESATSLSRESFGELLGQLANNSSALVRDEIQLAKQEMSEKFIRLRSAIIVVTAGAFIGYLATLALIAAAVIGLATYVGAGYAALIIGAALAIIGGITVLIGVSQIKRTSLKPEQTMETLEEDKEWLKDLM